MWSDPYGVSMMFVLMLMPRLLDTWKLSVSDFHLFGGSFCSLLGLMLGVQLVYHSFVEGSGTNGTIKDYFNLRAYRLSVR